MTFSELAPAILQNHQNGALLRTIEKHLPSNSAAGVADNFLLLGLLAEIFKRFNGGMGGSMRAFLPPFGAFPNNAIVCASGGIAWRAPRSGRSSAAPAELRSPTAAKARPAAAPCGRP